MSDFIHHRWISPVEDGFDCVFSVKDNTHIPAPAFSSAKPCELSTVVVCQRIACLVVRYFVAVVLSELIAPSAVEITVIIRKGWICGNNDRGG